MVKIKAGDGLCATVPVKNIGEVDGEFTLRGQIYYKTGSPTDAMLETGSNSSEPKKPISPGQIQSFYMRRSNWANGNPEAFEQGQRFDIKWEVTVSPGEAKVEAWDYDAVEHDRGYGKPAKPAPPYRISTYAHSSTDSEITIGWEGVSSYPPLTMWRVFRGSAYVDVGPGVRQHTFTNLPPDTSYVFKVRAYNDMGWTESDGVSLRTAKYVPTWGLVLPEINVGGTFFSPSTIGPGEQLTATIKVANIGMDPGDITVTAYLYDTATGTYQGALRGEGQTEPPYQVVLENVAPGEERTLNMYNYNFGDGNPGAWPDNTWFDCVVRAEAAVGDGSHEHPFSQITKWTTSGTVEGPPPQPFYCYRISSVAHSSTDAEITFGWDAVTANPPVTHYQAWYLVGTTPTKIGDFSPSNRQATITGLLPGSSVNVWASACNSYGCTNGKPGNLDVAHWVPPIGDAWPEIKTASHLTQFWPNNVTVGTKTYGQIEIQNIGEGDGEFKVTAEIMYADTNIVAGTLQCDMAPYEGKVQKGLHYCLGWWNQGVSYATDHAHPGWGDGFADGEKFDVLVNVTATIGTGKAWERFKKVFTFNAPVNPPPQTEPSLTVSVSGNQITAQAIPPADATGCEMEDIYQPGAWFATGANEFIWRDVPPGSYTVRARAVNAYGSGPIASETVQVESAPGKPRPPTLFFGNSGPNWIMFYWHISNLETLGGTIKFQLSDGQSTQASYSPNQSGSVTFYALQHGTSYQLTAHCVNTNGIVGDTASAWGDTSPAE